MRSIRSASCIFTTFCDWVRRNHLRSFVNFRKAGFWATQILPFGDPALSGGYVNFESAFYKSLQRRKAA